MKKLIISISLLAMLAACGTQQIQGRIYAVGYQSETQVQIHYADKDGFCSKLIIDKKLTDGSIVIDPNDYLSKKEGFGIIPERYDDLGHYCKYR
jgi:hypothetical protein